MTPDQIGEALTELKVGQAVTNAELGAIKELLTKHIETDEKTFVAHDKRIRSNERGRWVHTGAAGIFGSVVTAAITYFKFRGS